MLEQSISCSQGRYLRNTDVIQVTSPNPIHLKAQVVELGRAALFHVAQVQEEGVQPRAARHVEVAGNEVVVGHVVLPDLTRVYMRRRAKVNSEEES